MKKWMKEIAGELFPIIFPLLFMGGGWWLALARKAWDEEAHKRRYGE